MNFVNTFRGSEASLLHRRPLNGIKRVPHVKCLPCAPLASMICKFSCATLKIFQVALHYRLQIRVNDYGGGAFVFAKFGKDLVRDGERDGD